MPVYKNPVKRQFTWASASYLTVFCYTRSLTPQDFYRFYQPIIFREQTYVSFYTYYYSCYYTCIVQRRCSALHTSLAHGVIVFYLYHSCQQTNGQLNIYKKICTLDIPRQYIFCTTDSMRLNVWVRGRLNAWVYITGRLNVWVYIRGRLNVWVYISDRLDVWVYIKGRLLSMSVTVLTVSCKRIQ